MKLSSRLFYSNDLSDLFENISKMRDLFKKDQ